MQVSLSELKTNVGKYIGLSETQDIFITKNGKKVAKIISIKRDRVAEMKSLFGIAKLPPEYDDPNYDPYYKKLREERMGI
ncbi:MAG: type II toxin-antitoxin system prevent-host-death family antitoxin [Clostridiales bacterium]|nr:type II toxin-antitoxin system prevent-host-death family antitoxin [Clostridiales bacterium]